jgi:uncharacterized protein (DUF2461 family)
MSHFEPEFLQFFRGLTRRNTREWYQAHKAEYERFVKEPFVLFVGEMIERITVTDPACCGVMKPSSGLPATLGFGDKTA